MTQPSGGRSGSAALRAHYLARIAWLRTSGLSALLVLLGFVVFILPTLTSFGRGWHFVTDIAVLLILASGIIAVVEHRKLATSLAIVSLLVIAMRIAEWFTPHDLLPVLRNISILSALLLLVIAIGINVFAPSRAIGERLFGAIVVYLLLGLIWGVVYSVLGTHSPEAFSGQPGASPGLSGWVYFSFVTLTTVGYGDITPVTTGARQLAMLEALVGQLYPAVIIARLVSLQDTSK
jgi:hypothetical protein